MIIVKILVSLLIFGLIIFVLELGHFIMARLMKVQVNEFAIGMGPRLLKKKGKSGTVYSLRLLPIGGFCAMEGEDEEVPLPKAVGGNGAPEADAAPETDAAPAPEETPAASPAEPSAGKEKNTLGSLNSKKVWRRILIVVAGALMNLLLGYVILFLYLIICITPQQGEAKALYSTTTIAAFAENARSQQTGLREMDRIVRINGKLVFSDRDVAMLLQTDDDGVFDMTVVRDGTRVQLKDVTFDTVQNENGGHTLIYDFAVVGEEKTVLSTISYASRLEVSFSLMVWRSLGDIVRGKYGLNDISGPIGTMDVIGDAVQDLASSDWRSGLEYFLLLVALITINIGLFNLLPLPALDGGRLVFLIIEGITRRKVSPKVEGIIHLIGTILFLLLLVVVTFSDIIKIFQG
ncbi:MAG: site-2 protease family protein [Clostridia bacterium]|nr:site-2 protease family protein [Clostridia bacterium]